MQKYTHGEIAMVYGNRWKDIKYNKETKTWKPKRKYVKPIPSTKEERDTYTLDDVPTYLRKYL